MTADKAHWILNLPSAQPESSQSVVNASQSVVNDCISRQAAIDCVTPGAKPMTIRGRIAELPSAQPERIGDPERIYTELSRVYNMDAMPDEAKAIIGDLMISLPDAPERKKGRWIEQDDSWDGVYYECSACGEPWTTIDGTPWDNGMNYCPNCGARMEGEDNERA